jgi:divalent metal cation (Fe/Co/Zn/Cd) transporter
VLLCIYVLVSAVYGLLSRSGPESSTLGIVVAAAAVLVMPFLAWRKRDLASRLGSRALEEDADESITCAYMAGTVLLGVGLTAVVHWWWVEDVAALVFLYWLGRETLEALREAREDG